MTTDGKLMREQHSSTLEEQNSPRFSNYDLVRRIDVGGMGEVYLAHQRSAFGREVAIKIIRSDLVHDLTARARFLREAEVSAHLKHEHILPLFEFGEDQGRLFLVTPYIQGGTLARRIQSGPLTLSEVHQLFTPLVQAVAYIHRRGVIHRDLKPTNILLDQEDGQIYVRLIDFGIATLQGRSASPPLTTAGSEMGTIAYMAPERLSGIAAPSNDIYSLGIILYEMLTGHIPMPEQRTRIPQPLQYVVHRCIAPLPENRFTTAEELLTNFEQAYHYLTTAPRPPTSAHTGSSQSHHVNPLLNDSHRVQSAQSGQVSQASQSSVHPQQEVVSLQQAEEIPSFQPQRATGFVREDYEAPTTAIGPSPEPASPPKVKPVAAKKAPRTRKKRRRSLLVITSILMVVIIVIIAGMLSLGAQTVFATSVTVNVSPQTHVINKVFTITAQPAAQTINVGKATIPAKILSSTQTGSQTGPTTGVQCAFAIFNCQQSVSSSDVDTLTAQVKQSVVTQITQDLQKQASQTPGTITVGAIHLTDLSESASPPVGTLSKTVTVTLKEQGIIEYIDNSDHGSLKTLARALLAQQVQKLGQNYILLDDQTHPTVQIGQPVIESVNGTTGVVTIKIATVGIAEYQIPNSELQSIKAQLKGRTLKDARAFLAKQPGIDPNTIAIRFTSGSGDTLPSDLQHITLTALSPTLPPVQLQTLPAVTPSTT